LIYCQQSSEKAPPNFIGVKILYRRKNGGLKIFKCDESLANPRKKILSNKSLKNLLPVSSGWGDKWDAI